MEGRLLEEFERYCGSSNGRGSSGTSYKVGSWKSPERVGLSLTSAGVILYPTYSIKGSIAGLCVIGCAQES